MTISPVYVSGRSPYKLSRLIPNGPRCPAQGNQGHVTVGASGLRVRHQESGGNDYSVEPQKTLSTTALARRVTRR